MSRNAQRRQNDQRMQQRSERLIKNRALEKDPDPSRIKILAKKFRDILQVCSCQMCGNPRRKKGRKTTQMTIQERRQIQPEKNV